MAYCPNCRTQIARDAQECGACGALITTAGGWTPVDVWDYIHCCLCDAA